MAHLFCAVCVIIIGAVMSLYVPKRMSPMNREFTEPVEGRVVDYTLVREDVNYDDGTSGTISRKYPVFEFEYGGRTFRARSNYVTVFRPRIGKVVKLKINPNNTNRVAYDSSGTEKLMRVFGILIIAVGVITFFRFN